MIDKQKTAAASGWVSNIQKYSLQDGPGIRTTVFLKGCPLRCAWCHNPENIARQPEVVMFEGRCVRCGECRQVCPQGGPTEIDAWLEHERTDCTLCGACVEACPSGARQVIGREMSVAEVLDQILADRIFYDDSGGGVTCSGGEPLLQFGFLHALLVACREAGIHTVVDTCGFAPEEHLRAIAEFTDLFLYDLKFMDDAKHREFCGVSNATILQNLRTLACAHPQVWVRIPIIPGVNDHPAELEAMARFLTEIPTVQQINLLPYHQIGVHKFKRLHQPYRLPQITPPSGEYMEAVAARFAAAGVKVKIGG